MEHLGKVPRNSLTFAVRVGCKKDFVGLLRFHFKFVYDLGFARAKGPVWLVIMLNINAQAALSVHGEVADVALAGNNLIAVA